MNDKNYVTKIYQNNKVNISLVVNNLACYNNPLSRNLRHFFQTGRVCTYFFISDLAELIDLHVKMLVGALFRSFTASLSVHYDFLE